MKNYNYPSPISKMKNGMFGLHLDLSSMFDFISHLILSKILAWNKKQIPWNRNIEPRMATFFTESYSSYSKMYKHISMELNPI